MSLPVLAPRLAGVTPPVVEKPSSKEHTEAEWEAKRELIQKLYIQDNRKLSETMAILESKHGFAATWVYPPLEERVSTPESFAEQSTDQDDAGVEEVVRIPNRTKQNTALSLPLQVSRQGPYAGLEIVLGNVWSWSQAKLESHGLSSDPMSDYLANPNQPPIQDSRTMYRTFELVFDLWKHERGDLAGMAARKGFYVLEYVLTDDHPDLVWHMLDTIYDMRTGNFLRSIPYCKFWYSYGSAWLRNVHILGEQVGSLAPQHLWLYEQLIWDGRTQLRKDSDLKQRRELLTAALQNLSNIYQATGDSSTAHCLRVEALTLEFTQMDLDDKPQAEQLALQLLSHTEGAGSDPRLNARFHAYARKMLARVHQDRSDWDVAEQNLKHAILSRETAHGASNNLRVVRDMWVLADHYKRTGRNMEARNVAEDAINRAKDYLEDLPG
ncbi:uncharacterized protein J7T54_008192 [Emericellopsis cladophorae]|uniref:Clr5 domain-containing protein n=1 Tax=Emericellopsis cladophorae TaxID=2686198 RepID=A0A9P9XXK5_9HYPO|nr:uncharacterized protein J7T54_008192 [Emericellopsis cladophorae]KAI6779575.1 hypothetical protein J7T54_008192 [Emericellopsis cladophorae]